MLLQGYGIRIMPPCWVSLAVCRRVAGEGRETAYFLGAVWVFGLRWDAGFVWGWG